MEQLFDDKYFDEIDNLCVIVKPEHFDEIHLSTPDNKYLRVFAKNKLPRWYGKKHIVSAKEAIELVQSGIYEFRFAMGFGTRETIQAVWKMMDVIGKPYLKHWTELVNVFQDTKEPLVYSGPDIDLPYKNRFFNQLWCYKMANAILGLEKHDDILKSFFCNTDDIEKSVADAKKRWTITVNE